MFTLTNPSAITFPRFNADNSVSALTAANFRSAIGAGTVTTLTAAAGTPISITNNTTTPELSMNAASASVPGYLLSADWTTFNNKQAALGFTPANSTITIATTAPLQGGGNLTANRTLSITQASGSVNGFLSGTDWTNFNNKQSQLSGTGFVKASGTNITYDNSSYLRTGLADSTYLKLTGGTLTGALNVNGTSTLNFTNVYGKTTYVPFNVGLGEQSIFNVGAYLRGGTVMIFPDSSLSGSSGNLFFANSNVLSVEYSARGSGIRNYIKQGGDVNRNSLALYTSDIGQQNTNRLYINYNGDIGINDDTPSFKLDVNGTLGVTNAATLSSTLSVTGAVTLSTTTATPTTLLGKDGSNVVGTVTTVAQTGLFGRGSVTNAVTDANGNITVAHGFNFTPIMAFANLPGQTINIVNVKSVDNNNIVFVVRDGPTNDILNTISVAKIEFFAIK